MTLTVPLSRYRFNIYILYEGPEKLTGLSAAKSRLRTSTQVSSIKAQSILEGLAVNVIFINFVTARLDHTILACPLSTLFCRRAKDTFRHNFLERVIGSRFPRDWFRTWFLSPQISDSIRRKHKPRHLRRSSPKLVARISLNLATPPRRPRPDGYASI